MLVASGIDSQIVSCYGGYEDLALRWAEAIPIWYLQKYITNSLYILSETLLCGLLYHFWYNYYHIYSRAFICHEGSKNICGKRRNMGDTVMLWVECQTSKREVVGFTAARVLLCNNLRQVVHTSLPLSSSKLTPSVPAVPNSYCLKRSAPYWSNPPVLIFDIWALLRLGLGTGVPLSLIHISEPTRPY